MKNGIVAALALVILLLTSSTSQAISERFICGGAGVKCGSISGKQGFYYRTVYATYSTNKFANSKGEPKFHKFDAKLSAIVNRVLWITNKNIFGGSFGFGFVVPFSGYNVSISPAKGVSLPSYEKFTLGDIYLNPVVLTWNKKKYDLAFAVGWYLPTSKHDDAWKKDYLTTMISAGGTYYLTADKKWHISTLPRYEIHGEGKYQGKDNLTPGHSFHSEFGVGTTIFNTLPRPTKIWDIGVEGFVLTQVTKDKLNGETIESSVKSRTFGAGPSARLILPQSKLVISLRFIKEFGARNQYEGNLITFKATKCLF